MCVAMRGPWRRSARRRRTWCFVDIRGGYYMTDLVRFNEGRLGHPAVMALQMLSYSQIDKLCATRRVAIADRSLFWPLGVHQVSPIFRGSDYIEARRDHLAHDRLRERNRALSGRPVQDQRRSVDLDDREPCADRGIRAGCAPAAVVHPHAPFAMNDGLRNGDRTANRPRGLVVEHRIRRTWPDGRDTRGARH